MNWKRGILCIIGVLLFMVTVFQPGYRIIVDGIPLPGIYEPETALRSAEAAVRAADEITRTYEEAPFQLIPALCLKYKDADEAQLCGLLLTAYEGVVQVSSDLEDGATAFTYTYAGAEAH